jgi:hypothetical protein
MLRALERRRDHAHARAADLHRQEWQGGTNGDRRAAHDRWREIHADHERALDGVHRALVFARHAGKLLARLRRDRARGEGRGWRLRARRRHMVHPSASIRLRRARGAGGARGGRRPIDGAGPKEREGPPALAILPTAAAERLRQARLAAAHRPGPAHVGPVTAKLCKMAIQLSIAVWSLEALS